MNVCSPFTRLPTHGACLRNAFVYDRNDNNGASQTSLFLTVSLDSSTRTYRVPESARRLRLACSTKESQPRKLYCGSRGRPKGPGWSGFGGGAVDPITYSLYMFVCLQIAAIPQIRSGSREPEHKKTCKTFTLRYVSAHRHLCRHAGV